MKKTIALITAVLFVFAVASVSLAVQEKKTVPPLAEKKVAAKIVQVTGEVKSIDIKEKTITVVKKVKDKIQETVIAVDDKMLADIKAGDKVTVKYSSVGGKNTAQKITKPKKAESQPAGKK